MLRERLLKGISDELPMKEDFDSRSDFPRDAATEMDDSGQGNKLIECALVSTPHFRRASFPAQNRFLGAHARNVSGR